MKRKLKTQNSKRKTEHCTRTVYCLRFALCVLSFALSSFCFAAATPPRIFFSDAHLSFVIPRSWEVSSAFPYGPLMMRKAQDGSQAFIACQISDTLDPSRWTADVSTTSLEDIATRDVATRGAQSRILAASTGSIVGQNAYHVTWETPEGIDPTSALAPVSSPLPAGTEAMGQTVYFYLDNRFYSITLRANRVSFPLLLPDYRGWLKTIRRLSRDKAGKLQSPAHGGLWVHQTGGIRIAIPERWLIGVADDRQVGATVASDRMHVDFVATADLLSPAQELSPEEKREAKKAVTTKGCTILSESDEPFHGLPAYQVAYEGTVGGRYVRGQDLWIAGSKARWLINLEGDGALMRRVASEWQAILSTLHFL